MCNVNARQAVEVSKAFNFSIIWLAILTISFSIGGHLALTKVSSSVTLLRECCTSLSSSIPGVPWPHEWAQRKLVTHIIDQPPIMAGKARMAARTPRFRAADFFAFPNHVADAGLVAMCASTAVCVVRYTIFLFPQYRTALAYGFIIGTSFMMSMQMLTTAVLAGSMADYSEVLQSG